MNPLLKLAAPVVLGGLASVINWTVVKSQISPHSYVMVRQRVQAGQKIEGSALAALAVPGDHGQLRRTLIPIEDRDVIIGTPSRRELLPNDLILWQDVKHPDGGIEAGPDERILPIDISGVTVDTGLLYPGLEVDFWISPPRPEGRATARDAAEAGGIQPDYQLIGPFRIVSVGNDWDQFAAKSGEGRRDRSRGNDRVISISVKIQGNNKYDPSSRRLLDAHAQKRVMAIVLHPSVQPRS